MSLPFPSMDFTAFDILTAEEMDNLSANDQALAAGTGLDNDAVTPAKRSGGYKVGKFVAPSSTGNYSVTGLGFKPRKIHFAVGKTAADDSRAVINIGAVDEFGTQYTQSAVATSTQYRTRLSNARCIIGYSTPGGTLTAELVGVYVSMDSDGFTVNFTTANNSYDVCWEAEA